MPIVANVPSFRLLKRLTGASVLSALVTGGCAVSVPLSPFKSSSDDITGSIAKPVTMLSRRLDAEDWRRARAALGTALDPQGNGSVVAWENTQTGAKGNFTPVAQTYPSDDKICRAFLAKVETDGGLEELQGTACRETSADWIVRDVKPWKRA